MASANEGMWISVSGEQWKVPDDAPERNRDFVRVMNKSTYFALTVNGVKVFEADFVEQTGLWNYVTFLVGSNLLVRGGALRADQIQGILENTYKARDSISKYI